MSNKLVDEFRSRLDEALILAIIGEYNLDDKNSFEVARGVLKTLAQDASVDEATSFNPDGLAAHLTDLTVRDQNQESSNDDDVPPTQESETLRSETLLQSESQLSQLSSVTSPWDEDEEDIPRIASFDQSTEVDKIAQLRGMFLGIAEDKVKGCLERSGGDFQAALEELLTLQFLETLEPEPKTPRNATDDFFKPDEEPRRKRKGKKKRGQVNGSPVEEVSSSKCIDDILFISDRLSLTYDDVAGAYYQNQCSQGKTTVVVLDDFIKQGVEAQDAAGKNLVRELSKQYKRVPPEYLSVIVQLVAIPQFANDIAKVLEGHFSKSAKEHVALNYTLAPPEHLVTNGFTVVMGKKGNNNNKSVATASPTYVSSPSTSTRNTTWADATRQAAQYSEARSAAAASASQAARKGRSDPLFRQVAGVYADMARENGLRAQAASSAAADLLVSQQRTRNSIDLHGVCVRDGMRIAQAEVRAWYNSLGEYRTKKAMEEGFTVVTGHGRHSKSGVSVLRQGVLSGLVNDGWRVEVGTGSFTVTGRR